MNYYNEIEPYAAQWLLNLIAAGHIPPGDVDERSIKEVQPEDLRNYDQCHFFAGISGWSYALRLAGWPADQPFWTGSCPCQPYSAAGKRQGDADARNLWPDFYRLIRQCRPTTVIGEQVASAIGYGWLDGICADLEGEGYACGAAVLPACSVGAPHIRSRLFWVADSNGGRRQQCDEAVWGLSEPSAFHTHTGGLADAAREQVGRAGQPRQCAADGLGFAERARLEGHAGNGGDGSEPGRLDTLAPGSAWAASQLIYCGDEKWRRIPLESALFPLAHGVRKRVGKLRAAGNAIVAQVAAEFIKASL